MPSIQAIKNIEVGEEVTVSYDYALEDAPPWYQELYAQRVLNCYAKSREAE